MVVRTLSGWGRTAPTAARLCRPRTPEDAVRVLADAGRRGVVARGLGRAYGDAAQNAGGTVLDMTGLDRVLSIDAEDGLVRCEAGVSLHRLMHVLLPLGWFVPVTPGTRFVTVGGAVGADIHGKNHHVSGSFTRHVMAMDLLLPGGEIRTVAPGDPLFEATAGGMGLTGVVLRATIRLLPVETARMTVTTERAADLDDLMRRLESADHRYRYSVAWIDLLAKGRALGRSVITRGDHAALDDLTPKQRGRGPLTFTTPSLPPAPRGIPGGLLRPLTVGLFNELWFRRAPRERHGEIQSIPAFFHPLDGLPEWNRVYGPSGFVQYQFVVGPDRADVLRTIVQRVSERGYPTFLAVLKRFGPGDSGWLSFPREGWTLALDLPTGLPGLDRFLDDLDETVATAGGRVYLAKDSRLRPELLSAMYPRLPDFRRLRAEIDPHRVLVSDLARRLDL